MDSSNPSEEFSMEADIPQNQIDLQTEEPTESQFGKESPTPRQITLMQLSPSSCISAPKDVVNSDVEYETVEQPVLLHSVEDTPSQNAIQNFENPEVVLTIEEASENKIHSSEIEQEEKLSFDLDLHFSKEENLIEKQEGNISGQEQTIQEESEIPCQDNLSVNNQQSKSSEDVSMVKENEDVQKINERECEDEGETFNFTENDQMQVEEETEQDKEDICLQNNPPNDLITREGEDEIDKIQIEEDNELEHETTNTNQNIVVDEENTSHEAQVAEVKITGDMQIEEQTNVPSKIDEEVENEQPEPEIQQTQDQCITENIIYEQEYEYKEKQEKMEEEEKESDFNQVGLENESSQEKEEIVNFDNEAGSSSPIQKEIQENHQNDDSSQQINSLEINHPTETNLESKIDVHEKESSAQNEEELVVENADSIAQLAPQITSASSVGENSEEIDTNLLPQVNENTQLSTQISCHEEKQNTEGIEKNEANPISHQEQPVLETKRDFTPEKENAQELLSANEDFRVPKIILKSNGKDLTDSNQNEQEDQVQALNNNEIQNHLENIIRDIEQSTAPNEIIAEDNFNEKALALISGIQEGDSMLIENENDLQSNFPLVQERLSEIPGFNILCTGEGLQDNEDLLTDTACLKFNAKIYNDESAEKKPKNHETLEENNESAMLIEKDSEPTTETYIVGRQIKPPTFLERKLQKYQEENIKSMGAFDFKKCYSKLEKEKMSSEKLKEEQKLQFSSLEKPKKTQTYSSFMSDMKPHFTKLQMEKMTATKSKEGSQSVTQKSASNMKNTNSSRSGILTQSLEKLIPGKKTVETPTSRNSFGISPLNKKRGWENFNGKSNEKHDEEDIKYREMKKVKKDEFQSTSLENVLAGSIKKISKIEMDKIKNKQQEQVEKEQALKRQHIENKGEVFKMDNPIPISRKENISLNRKVVSNSKKENVAQKTNKSSGTKVNKACVFCGSNFEGKVQIKTLSCLHRSHTECFISMERKKKAKCPTCNSNSLLGGFGQFGKAAVKIPSIKF